MGLLDDLFDPGSQNRETASGFAQQGIISGVDVSGPGGITASSGFSGGQATTQFGLGSFNPFLSGLQGLSQTGIDQAQQGFGEFARADEFAGLGDIFKSSLGTAQADPFELGSGISEKLRAISERRNQRGVNKFFDRLKSSGNLTSSAGIQRAGDLERNLFEQGLQFDLAGLNAGRGIQQDAFQRALGSSQGRGGIFSQFLNQQAQGANIGLQAIGGAQQLSTLPLAFLQQSQAGAGLASNSLFAASGIETNLAQLAKSPFLEALNAAGSFAGAVAPGGFAGNPVGTT